MKETKDKQNSSVKAAERKRTIIVICIVAAALLIALIPIIKVIIDSKKEEPPAAPAIPENALSGTYTLNLAPSGFSQYTFHEGTDKVTHYYAVPRDPGDIANGSGSSALIETTVEFTYKIVSVNGKNYLELTDVKDGKIESHPIEFGTSEWIYYRCANEQCIYNSGNNGRGEQVNPSKDGSGRCPSHPDSEITKVTYCDSSIYIGEGGVEAPEYIKTQTNP